MEMEDTIAAIATASGNAGIGIIRVSGQEAVEIVDKIFFPAKSGAKLANTGTHTINYGYIKDGKDVLDQVLVSIMRSPHSYTGEDTVEINCHGGMLVLKKVLELVIKSGARTAQPGEFTKRAFLNGKEDLSQAEAVMDLVEAENDFALHSAMEQLKGGLSKKIKEVRSEILYYMAKIESALDDPEHMSLDGCADELEKMLCKNMEIIRTLADTYDNGRILREGINTVIAGKPNVGKSSLLNRLLGNERAIVTKVAGTTRDTLEEYAQLGGITLKLVDTAGIRETKNSVERIGVDRAKSMIESADLVLFLMDGSGEITSEDVMIEKMSRDKKRIVLLNKSDISQKISVDEVKKFTGDDPIKISAKKGDGIDTLSKKITEIFDCGDVSYNDQIYVTQSRHKEALENAYNSLNLVREANKEGISEDLYLIDLMDAYTQLGSITGESVEDDLVDEIFSKFCMGK